MKSLVVLMAATFVAGIPTNNPTTTTTPPPQNPTNPQGRTADFTIFPPMNGATGAGPNGNGAGGNGMNTMYGAATGNGPQAWQQWQFAPVTALTGAKTSSSSSSSSSTSNSNSNSNSNWNGPFAAATTSVPLTAQSAAMTMSAKGATSNPPSSSGGTSDVTTQMPEDETTQAPDENSSSGGSGGSGSGSASGTAMPSSGSTRSFKFNNAPSPFTYQIPLGPFNAYQAGDPSSPTVRIQAQTSMVMAVVPRG